MTEEPLPDLNEHVADPADVDEHANAEASALPHWPDMRGDRDIDPTAPNPHQEA